MSTMAWMTSQAKQGVYLGDQISTSECNVWPIGKQETFGHVVVDVFFAFLR